MSGKEERDRPDESPATVTPDEVMEEQIPGETKKSRTWLRFISNLLIVLGILIVLGVGAVYGYSLYLEQQARSDPWLAQVQAAWDERVPQPGTAPEGSPTADQSALAAPSPEARGTPGTAPTATATASPTATPRVYPPAVGIRIPSIDVDSRVVEVGLKDGEYEVPKFYVGRYRDTAQPGELGNGVYTGHVESLQSGNVFASLGKIDRGDEVFLYTNEGVWVYRITATQTVRNDDLSVMAPSPDHRITLITCTGTFDVQARQYTHRFVAIGELVNEGEPMREGPEASR